MARKRTPLIPEAREGLDRLRRQIERELVEEDTPYTRRFREIADQLTNSHRSNPSPKSRPDH